MQPERADMNKDLGALSGSREPSPSSTGLGLSGFDPARVEVLSLGYCSPPIGCSKTRWWEVFRPFIAAARYHAANLAAHNWDVLLVGERVFLFQQRYGGDTGHWLNEDGTREDATREEHARLYTKNSGRRFAIATEAGTAATVEQGAVHEGAGPQDIAQGPSQ